MAGAEVFVDNLVGTWKRCLQWRHFGGAFQYLRSSNTVIVVSADFKCMFTTAWLLSVTHLDRGDTESGGFRIPVTRSHPNACVLSETKNNLMCSDTDS